MHILFVDESGTPPPFDKHDDKEYFVLGGIVVPEDIWAKLAQDLRLLARRYKIEGEIKWRYFAPAKPSAKLNSLSHLSAEQKESLRTALYEKICHYKSVRLICVATQVAPAYTLPYIKTADDLYWYSYKQLTERFQYYLQDLERTVGQRVNGIIVCDHRAPKDDARLRELHFQLLNSSKTTVTRYSNLIEGLFIAPSHLSVGIQFADMVAGAVFRYVKVGDERYMRQIRPAFRQAPDGNIDGYGLVRFPKGEG